MSGIDLSKNGTVDINPSNDTASDEVFDKSAWDLGRKIKATWIMI